MHLSISSVWLIFFILSGVSKCNEIPSNSKDSSEVQTNQNDVNNNLNTLTSNSIATSSLAEEAATEEAEAEADAEAEEAAKEDVAEEKAAEDPIANTTCALHNKCSRCENDSFHKLSQAPSYTPLWYCSKCRFIKENPCILCKKDLDIKNLKLTPDPDPKVNQPETNENYIICEFCGLTKNPLYLKKNDAGLLICNSCGGFFDEPKPAIPAKPNSSYTCEFCQKINDNAIECACGGHKEHTPNKS